MRIWVLSDKEVTPLGGTYWFAVPSLLWFMTGDWELWFPGSLKGSGAFWPPSYTHPVLSEKLKQLDYFIILHFLIFFFIVFNSTTCHYLDTLRYIALYSATWNFYLRMWKLNSYALSYALHISNIYVGFTPETTCWNLQIILFDVYVCLNCKLI